MPSTTKISKLLPDPLWILPAAKFLLHLVTLRGYGPFRDEFYYLACAARPDFGYVDHPPLSIWLLSLLGEIFGPSITAGRVLAALIGAALVLVVGLIAREFGGRRPAQTLAMTAALLAPPFLAIGHFYSMNVLDQLIWAVAALLLARIIHSGDEPRLWLLLGAVLGLGLLNKLSVLWLGLGLAAGLVLTRERRTLLTPWPWVAGALSMALLLPHVLWQIHHGWPTREFIANAQNNKMAEVAPLDFLGGQIDMMNPLMMPLWMLGLVSLFFLPAGRRFRLLGWVYVTVFLLLMLNGTSRSGYLAPAYAWLLAAGAVALERLVERLRSPTARRAAMGAALAWTILAGVVVMPLALPVLPVEDYLVHARRLGAAPSTEEKKELAELPQFFADMHGWQAKTDAVTAVVAGLSPAERDAACIFALNYGVAGAVAHLGVGLPPVLSGHNNYSLWGPGSCSGEVMVVVGRHRGLLEHYLSIEEAAEVDCGRCMPYENHQTIYVARGLETPLAELWPELVHFD